MSLNKNRLQEYCVEHKLGQPIYTNIKNGPDDMARFVSSVKIGDKQWISGECDRKKTAEDKAAEIACKALNIPECNFKNKLQVYLQQSGNPIPIWSTEKRPGGFLGKVNITNHGVDFIFETSLLYDKVKTAEQEASKIAYVKLTSNNLSKLREVLINPGDELLFLHSFNNKKIVVVCPPGFVNYFKINNFAACTPDNFNISYSPDIDFTVIFNCNTEIPGNYIKVLWKEYENSEIIKFKTTPGEIQFFNEITQSYPEPMAVYIKDIYRIFGIEKTWRLIEEFPPAGEVIYCFDKNRDYLIAMIIKHLTSQIKSSAVVYCKYKTQVPGFPNIKFEIPRVESIPETHYDLVYCEKTPEALFVARTRHKNKKIYVFELN